MELCPVFTDQFTGIRFTLHGVNAAFGCRQRKLHAHTAGACAHIPQSVGGHYRQLCQRSSAHLLLGHGHLAPDEAFVREARRTQLRQIKVFHQKHAEWCKALPRQLCSRAVADGFRLGAKVFAHHAVGFAHTGIGQLLAQRGGRFSAAGEEVHRTVHHALGHRVAGAAMGRDQLPVLPRTAQRR